MHVRVAFDDAKGVEGLVGLVGLVDADSAMIGLLEDGKDSKLDFRASCMR